MITLQNYYNVISCEQSTWSRILGAINLSLSEAITWKKSKKRNQTSQRSPDAIRHQQADLSLVEAADKYAELEKRKPRWKQKLLACVRFIAKNWVKKHKTDEDAVSARNYQKEQADMGKLKKSVRGLVVVHPMTALGREMGWKRWPGFQRPRFKPLRRLVRSYQPASDLR